MEQRCADTGDECPRVVLLSSASSQHHVCARRCLILQFHAPEPVCQRAHKTLFRPADANRLRGDRRRQTRGSEVKKQKQAVQVIDTRQRERWEDGAVDGQGRGTNPDKYFPFTPSTVAMRP